MHQFWTSVATFLTRRAGAVLAVCVLISLVLGFGATKLDFATGQDSYLNNDSQIAIDNTGLSGALRRPGHRHRAERTRGRQGHRSPRRREPAVAPGDGRQDRRRPRCPKPHRRRSPPWSGTRTSSLPAAGSTDPTTSVAAEILLGAVDRETDPAAEKARTDDAVTTLSRVNEAGGRARR